MSSSAGEIKPLCSFYQKGACTYGKKCVNSHDIYVDPSIVQKNVKINRPCKNFANGSCLMGDNCSYIHQVIKIEPVPSEEPKNIISKKSEPISNQLIEINTPSNQKDRSKLCINYQKGSCRHGKNCHFIHDQNVPKTSIEPKEVESIKEVKIVKELKEVKESKQVKEEIEPIKEKVKKDYKEKKKEIKEVKEKGKKDTLTLDNLLKYHDSSNEVDFYIETESQYKDYKYKIYSEDNSVIITKAPNQKDIGKAMKMPESSMFPTKNGIFFFDSDKMYTNQEREGLLIQHDLSFTPKEKIQFKLPYVKEARRFKIQGKTLIFFIPYDDHLKGTFFKEIRVYRWNSKFDQYSHCFNYSYEGFNITCASSNSYYLALSRLPYNKEAIETKQEKEQMEYQTNKQIEFEQKEKERLLQIIEKQQNEIEKKQELIDNQKTKLDKTQEFIKKQKAEREKFKNDRKNRNNFNQNNTWDQNNNWNQSTTSYSSFTTFDMEPTPSYLVDTQRVYIPNRYNSNSNFDQSNNFNNNSSYGSKTYKDYSNLANTTMTTTDGIQKFKKERFGVERAKIRNDSFRTRFNSSNQRFEQLKQMQINQSFAFEQRRRDADPIDLFIFDQKNNEYKRVLEYHKAADGVQVFGNHLYIVFEGQTHHFEFKVSPSTLKNYRGLVVPEKLCSAF